MIKRKKTNEEIFQKLKPLEIDGKNKKNKRGEQKKEETKKEEKRDVSNPFTNNSERFEDFSSIETRAPVLETNPLGENLEQQITNIPQQTAEKAEEKINVVYNAPDYGDEFYKRINYGTSDSMGGGDIEMDITRGRLMHRENVEIEQQDRGTRNFGTRFGLNQEGLVAGRGHDSTDVEERYVIREKEQRDRAKLPFES